MQLTPTLYIVTTERESTRKAGEYPIVVPTVRYATTSHWLAKLIRWWHGGTISHDMMALSEHGQPFEDRL